MIEIQIMKISKLNDIITNYHTLIHIYCFKKSRKQTNKTEKKMQDNHAWV